MVLLRDSSCGTTHHYKKSKSGQIAAGRTVLIPTAAALAGARDVPDPAIERYGSSRRHSVTHVVKQGETLGAIAHELRHDRRLAEAAERPEGRRDLAGAGVGGAAEGEEGDRQGSGFRVVRCQGEVEWGRLAAPPFLLSPDT